jgi:protein-disulfide isomerase
MKYGNYQCSHCATAYKIVKAIQTRLDGQLRFVFRHFPCPSIHPYAQHAAEAAEAAAAQGKFWEMHEYLLEHQQELDDGDLVKHALTLNLDVNQFLHDITGDVHVDRVREDFESGVHSGVSSTPTFFINGVRHDGAWDKSTLIAMIASHY